MATINTYEIYRKVYFRHKNAQHVHPLTKFYGEEMVKFAKLTAISLTKEHIERFREFEDCYLTSRNPNYKYRLYWREFDNAFRSGDYEYKENKIFNLAHYPHKKEKGIVYICTSFQKKRQVKIGKTKMKLYDRLRRLYKSKDYLDLVLKFAIEVDDHAKLEKLVHEFLKSKRVSGKAKNDSIEWFSSSLIEAKKTIFKIIDENNINVINTKFEGGINNFV